MARKRDMGPVWFQYRSGMGGFGEGLDKYLELLGKERIKGDARVSPEGNG